MKNNWYEVYPQSCIDDSIGNGAILSKLYISVYTTFVSIYTHMFTIWPSGLQKTWPHKRAYTYYMENTPLQPMGWQRI